MDLHTGTPVWVSSPTRRIKGRPLKTNVETDVVVVGAGITGALVTHELLKAGLRVVVVEKRQPGVGSTYASTGLLMYQPDTSLAEIRRWHGAAAAKRIYQLGRNAIKGLRELGRELSGSGGAQAFRTLYVASSKKDVKIIRQEEADTKRIGFPITLLDGAALKRRFKLDRPAGLLEPGAAQIDPYRFTQAVWQECARIGKDRYSFFCDTRITKLSDTSDGVEARTQKKNTISAKYAIFAAGYETMEFVDSSLISLHSTYVIASKPMAPRALKTLRCLTWESARPYFYLRTTPDRRILFGGRDEPFSSPSRRDRLLVKKARELKGQFAELYPELAFEPDYAWTGTFAETKDGLPCIGPGRSGSRILYALGYGGNGITFSHIAARILRDLCLGRENSDAKFFRFDRKIKKGRSRK